MNRLRFRAWHVPDQKMYEVIQWNFEEQMVGLQPNLGFWNIDDLIIMQSTGLFDASGKEIYEGDIYLLLSQKKLCKTEAARRRCAKIVEWNEKTAGFNLSTDQCEVTGNIYENPELML